MTLEPGSRVNEGRLPPLPIAFANSSSTLHSFLIASILGAAPRRPPVSAAESGELLPALGAT